LDTTKRSILVFAGKARASINTAVHIN